MRERRIHASGTSTKKKRRLLYKGEIHKSDLVKISEGKELRGQTVCFHIGEIHPTTISQINISGMHNGGKAGIIKWIKEGKIYIRKE